MRSFKDMPIKQKLMLIVVLTNPAVLITAGAALVIYERTRSRDEIVNRITGVAQLIGANSAAALTFERADDAERILETLRGKEHIVAAGIYDQRGNVFAILKRSADAPPIPSRAEAAGYRIDGGQLTMVQPIQFQNEQIGTIFLQAHLDELDARLKSYGAILATILLGSFLLAFLMTSMLQKLISEPILQLCGTVKQISARKDYSVRAAQRGKDELGLLIDGFNEMLGAIQSRDGVLRESEEQFRTEFEMAGVGKAHCDPASMRIVRVNRKMCEITGFSEDELLTKNSEQLTHPDDHMLNRAAIESLSSGATGQYGIEKRYVRKDGRVIWVAVNATLLYDIAGRAQRLVAIIQDVTERVRAEEEVRALNESLERRVAERTAELESANKELEAFSYSVSHDLRAPLRSIDGFSQIIEERCASTLDASAKGYFRRVRDATRRMGQLIEDMLMLSRITRSEMRHDAVDLSEMAEAVVQELRQREPQRRVEFAAEKGAMTRGDRNLLRIVLDNLLGNAWKYSGKRDLATIRFGILEDSEKRTFFVRDNGAGFDMAYANRLFNAFQRLHTPSEFPGSGIGLAIVSRIIQRHGGSTWAEAEVEKGATVFFRI